MQTYQITDPSEVFGLGPCIGTITNALNGRVEACFRGGERVPLNAPLCVGCDTPIEDDHCADCEPVANAMAA